MATPAEILEQGPALAGPGGPSGPGERLAGDGGGGQALIHVCELVAATVGSHSETGPARSFVVPSGGTEELWGER